MIIPVLLIFILTIFLTINYRAFSGFLLFLIFGILTFAPRAIREDPFTFTGQISFFEIILISIVIAWFLGKYYRFANFWTVPISNILFIIFVLIFVANFRGFFSANNMSAKMDYLRTFPIIFTMPLILTTDDYHRRIIQVYGIMCLSVLTISLITISVYVGNFVIPGLKYEMYQRTLRVVWGGMGPVVPFTAVMLLVTSGYFSKRWRYLLISISTLSIFAIFLSQSRQLVAVGLLLLFLWFFYSKGIVNPKKKSIYFAIVLIVMLVIWELPIGVYESFLNRLSHMNTDVNILRNISSGEMRYSSFERIIPFIYSFQSATDFWEVLYGRGSEVTDPAVGGRHLHSGWGFIYTSMGLIGICIFLKAFHKIFFTYQGLIKEIRKEFYIDLMILINMYLVCLAIMGTIVGTILQSYSIAFNGVLLGIMELIRRESIKSNE